MPILNLVNNRRVHAIQRRKAASLPSEFVPTVLTWFSTAPQTPTTGSYALSLYGRSCKSPDWRSPMWSTALYPFATSKVSKARRDAGTCSPHARIIAICARAKSAPISGTFARSIKSLRGGFIKPWNNAFVSSDNCISIPSRFDTEFRIGRCPHLVQCQFPVYVTVQQCKILRIRFKTFQSPTCKRLFNCPLAVFPCKSSHMETPLINIDGQLHGIEFSGVA